MRILLRPDWPGIGHLLCGIGQGTGSVEGPMVRIMRCLFIG